MSSHTLGLPPPPTLRVGDAPHWQTLRVDSETSGFRRLQRIRTAVITSRWRSA